MIEATLFYTYQKLYHFNYTSIITYHVLKDLVTQLVDIYFSNIPCRQELQKFLYYTYFSHVLKFLYYTYFSQMQHIAVG